MPHVTWIYVRSGGNLITKVSERKKKRSASQEVVMTKPIFVLRVIMSIFPFSNLRPKKSLYLGLLLLILAFFVRKLHSMKYSYACLDKRVAVTINIELFPPSHFLECKYLDPPHIKSKKGKFRTRKN